MKKLFVTWTRRNLLVVFLAVPAAAFSASPSPEEVVRDLIDAMLAGDAVRIRAAFADNASQAYGAGPARTGDAFRAWLESDIIAPNGRVENARFQPDGKSVVVTGQYENDTGYTSAADFLISVNGGKIVSWQMRY